MGLFPVFPRQVCRYTPFGMLRFRPSTLPRLSAVSVLFGDPHHQFVYSRVEQIVQPGGPGSFLEGHRQSSAQARKELKNGRRFGLEDGFHDQLTGGIPHRDHDGCLMNVEPNILFTVHKGAPFVSDDVNHHNLLQQVAPFYNAITWWSLGWLGWVRLIWLVAW